MKKMILCLTLLCVLAVGTSASAATVAYWKFEEGPAGAQVPKTTNGYTYEESVPDYSGNGYELSVWDEDGAGYVYRTDTAGQDSLFSVKNSGSGPAMWTSINDPISTMTPLAWTIEATFKLENGGYKCIVGRDSVGTNTAGTSPNGNLSALYFQTVPDNGLGIKFCDVSGYWYEAIAPANSYVGFDWGTDPDGTLVPWYSMAAVSDGTTLSLYLLQHGVDTEYQLIAQTDMTVSNPGSPDRALTAGAGGTSDWTAGEWSVGRGLYGGGHGDRAYGFLDEIRISDTALAPSEFLKPAFYYDSPAKSSTLIPFALTAPENDLVFTINDTNIADVEVYLEANDPNGNVLIDTLTSVTMQQYTIDLETQLASDLLPETDYYWTIIGYEPNAVSGQNDIPVGGQVWSFTTAPETPVMTSGVTPAFITVDAGDPNIILSVTGINGDFQWYKDGAEIDDAAGVYAGTDTDTLEIFDVQLADEGYYTCTVSNLIGEDESDPARVMTKRLTSYYDFESISTLADGNDVFVDSEDGYHAVLMQESASAGLPTVGDVNQLDPSMGNYLVLDNGDNATDPNGQYLQVYPGAMNYEDMTISMWVHMKSYLGWARLFDFGVDQDTNLFMAPDNGDGLAIFTIREQGGDAHSVSAHWLYTGQWYHVAVTISGDTGRMYINGERVAINEGMNLDPVDIGATINYIGESFYDSDPEFDGLIDELKIYNYALSTHEVAQQYLDIIGGSVCDIEGTADMTYDFDGDCKVDLVDFAMFAASWLNDNRIYD